MKEIGSEFWLNEEVCDIENKDLPKWLNLGSDNRLVLSGRTALHLVLKDILAKHVLKTVYFPSYCCQSMLQPFIDLGIEIVFYDVYYEDELRFNININQKCDIFFAMNYFGFSLGRMDKYIEKFKKRNVIIIEDSTHSLLSSKVYNQSSDYIIVSLRKWFPIISGGLAVKRKGRFTVNQEKNTYDKMINLRKTAMLLKGRYISEDALIEKEKYLDKYSKANNMLNEKYQFFNIDTDSSNILKSLDIELVISKRKTNSALLYKSLPIVSSFTFLFNDIKEDECPIFIPIILKSKVKRDRLRDYLISNSIYCPVHWPKPQLVNRNYEVSTYDRELSLIIDQRYDEEEMQLLVRRLVDFYE